MTETITDQIQIRQYYGFDKEVQVSFLPLLICPAFRFTDSKRRTAQYFVMWGSKSLAQLISSLQSLPSRLPKLMKPKSRLTDYISLLLSPDSSNHMIRVCHYMDLDL